MKADINELLNNTAGQELIERINTLPGPRVLVALAGPPGSGKSTLAAALVAALSKAVLVPMDGFHLDDSLLDARGLLARKGAPETFDADGFAVLAERLRSPSSEVIYPVFDRTRELSLAGAGVVQPAHRIVLIEGNYLLLNRAPWNRASYDLTVQIEVPEDEIRRRLEARWQGFGKDKRGIMAKLENDMANASLVTAESMAADVVFLGQ